MVSSGWSEDLKDSMKPTGHLVDLELMVKDYDLKGILATPPPKRGPPRNKGLIAGLIKILLRETNG